MTWFRFRVPMRQLSLGDTVIEMDGNDGNIGLGDSWGPTNATSRFFHIKARARE